MELTMSGFDDKVYAHISALVASFTAHHKVMGSPFFLI